MRWPGACGVALACLLWKGEASAFKEPGHRAIEAAAYHQLLSSAEGQAVLQKLIAYGVLKPPRRPFPEPSRLHADFAKHTAQGLLLETHMPDHLLDRQFDKELQCFHFNARGSHVTRIEGKLFGVPRGLVVDAYIECLGVADSLLRSVLFDPPSSAKSPVGVYALMHMIEDSFADSHVARSPHEPYPIIYVKPWNLRTWWTYLLAEVGSPNEATREHFADTHHGMVEPRDSGYLVGPTDGDACLTVNKACEPQQVAKYADRIKRCKAAAGRLLGRQVELDDLGGDVIVPELCLSDRAIWAKKAVVALLELIAAFADRVGPAMPGSSSDVRSVGPDEGMKTFAKRWVEYRSTYLLHVDSRLTETMSLSRLGDDEKGRPCPPLGCVPPHGDVRGDLVYNADDLIPRAFRTAGVGLSAELTAGTPLWLGFDALVAGSAGAHSKISPLTDFMGYAVQLRLPLENELGEHPVGAAVDYGPSLPVPVSELAAKDPTGLVVYVGLRGRLAYSAQSVFQDNTRHLFDLGFGGISVDFVAANRIWFGGDFPRIMWRYDSWSRDWSRSLTWGFNGGVAVDAF